MARSDRTTRSLNFEQFEARTFPTATIGGWAMAGLAAEVASQHSGIRDFLRYVDALDDYSADRSLPSEAEANQADTLLSRGGPRAYVDEY